MKRLFLLKSSLVRIFLLSSMIISFVPYTTYVKGDDINPGLFSKDSAPYGIPYAEWIAKWWNWTMSIPAPEHPRDEFSSKKCSVNQEGPVWFLADQLGGREERTCTIPAEKAILIPLLTGECGYDDPELKNDEDLRRCAIKGNEYSVVEAMVDGIKIKNLEQYRTQSGIFNATQVKDNIYEAPPGTYRAFAEGYFVFLEPLQVGRHDVNLKVSVLNPIEPIYNYNADWTYHLNIEP